jgi:hypothetical protein
MWCKFFLVSPRLFIFLFPKVSLMAQGRSHKRHLELLGRHVVAGVEGADGVLGRVVVSPSHEIKLL